MHAATKFHRHFCLFFMKLTSIATMNDIEIRCRFYQWFSFCKENTIRKGSSHEISFCIFCKRFYMGLFSHGTFLNFIFQMLHCSFAEAVLHQEQWTIILAKRFLQNSITRVCNPTVSCCATVQRSDWKKSSKLMDLSSCAELPNYNYI